MKYDFDKVIDRSGTASIKYDRRKEVFGRDDIIPMWVADMDFATPDFILDALKQRLEHPVLGYTLRQKSFFQAFQNWAKKRYNWETQLDWMTFSPGVVAALALSVLAYSQPGDKIIIQTPVYPPFFEVVENLDRELVINQLKPNSEGKYFMDLDDLKAKIDKKTKIIIISNPHNPVGRVWTKEELENLAKLAIENDLIIVSDDIHADFVYKGYKYTPIASIAPEIADRTITALSPSKTFNIAGLSTSIVVIPNPELRELYNEKLKGMHIFLGNIFGNIAFEKAYTYGEQWLDQLLQYLEQNIDLAVNYINQNIPKIKVWRPEGTFLLWLNFKDTGLSHAQIWQKLINEAKLGFNNGLAFGKNGEYHFRMNIAAPRQIVLKALEQLEKTFK